MQEHVPDEMLSRAYSYDMLGSFVAIPVGPAAVRPARRWPSASRHVMLVVAASRYIAISLS